MTLANYPSETLYPSEDLYPGVSGISPIWTITHSFQLGNLVIKMGTESWD